RPCKAAINTYARVSSDISGGRFYGNALYRKLNHVCLFCSAIGGQRAGYATPEWQLFCWPVYSSASNYFDSHLTTSIAPMRPVLTLFTPTKQTRLKFRIEYGY